MKAEIAGFLARLGLGPEVSTVVFGMLPIFELRGAIPWATFMYDMNWRVALGWSMLGNALPIPLIIWLLDPIQRRLSRWGLAQRFFEWLFARSRRKGKVIENYKAVGLMLFVAIPLPVTGAWTGAVAAYLFGIRFWKALPAIYAGVLIAGVIVTLACQGVLGFWDLSKGM